MVSRVGWMSRSKLLAKIDGKRIEDAIRRAELATSGEIRVSSTIRDLVAGSGIEFADRGSVALRGVPEEHRLFAVAHA